MRLLLDVHLSPRRIAAPLREAGRDVVALAEEAGLRAMTDPDVLAFAAGERRILVTRNAKDFAPLLRQWAEEGRHHAGCILIWTLGHHEFDAIVHGVNLQLADRADPDGWRDLTVAF